MTVPRVQSDPQISYVGNLFLYDSWTVYDP